MVCYCIFWSGQLLGLFIYILLGNCGRSPKKMTVAAYKQENPSQPTLIAKHDQVHFLYKKLFIQQLKKKTSVHLKCLTFFVILVHFHQCCSKHILQAEQLQQKMVKSLLHYKHRKPKRILRVTKMKQGDKDKLNVSNVLIYPPK